MEGKIKLSIIVFIVLMSVVAAVYIVLFSLGLKVNWQNRTIDQTSIVSITTKPSSASIFIDGRDINRTTPALIRWVMPGSYRLELKKDFYHDFNIEIKTEPGLATEIKNIRLFLKEPGLETVSSANEVKLINGNSAGYFWHDNTIKFFSLNPERIKTVYENERNIKSIKFNKEVNRAIINQEKLVNLFDGKEIVSLNKVFAGFSNFQFIGNNSYLLAEKDNQFFSLDLKNRKSTKLINKNNTSSYLVYDGIFYIDKRKNPRLVKIDFSNEEEVLAKTEISYDSFDKEKTDTISLAKLSLKLLNDQLFLVDEQDRYLLFDDDKYRYVGNDLTSITKLNNHTYLITDSFNEITLIDLKEQDKKVYLRTSTQASSPKFISDDYLIYQQDNRVSVYQTVYETGWQISGDLKVDTFWPIDDRTILVLTKSGDLIKLEIS